MSVAELGTLAIDLCCAFILVCFRQHSNSLNRAAFLSACNDVLDNIAIIMAGGIHHNDKANQYLSIRYSERLVASGIRPSTDKKGDAYDNTLAETIIGLYEVEVIRH
ncbi:MAG: hypothetical protein GX087_07335 [Desulfobulbaceae bacterium]|nr:hypothetical protein [Desulfobulbaceae bacterium]